MSTARARYMGGSDEGDIPDFSDGLRDQIKALFPGEKNEQHEVWGHPADDFVERVLAVAWRPRCELHTYRFDLTKQEIRAELADVLKRLREVEGRLRKLSPEVERRLPVPADPLACADKIEELVEQLEAAQESVGSLPNGMKPAEKVHGVMVEMAVCVLRVLNEFGIRASATSNPDMDSHSDAVKLLKFIGDDIQLVRTEVTWRDVIVDAKQLDPTL